VFSRAATRVVVGRCGGLPAVAMKDEKERERHESNHLESARDCDSCV
jgi:hypothetical protein